MAQDYDMREVYEKVLEETSSIIYLADIETYELVYISRGMLRIMGRAADDVSYRGKQCYEVLQGRDAPCEFCNNDRLEEDRFVCWEHFNTIFNRYLSIRDKKIRISGRELRMEIADDITRIMMEKQRLQDDLKAEKSLMLCIQNLTAAESHDKSIHELLQKVCELYEGERGYIFEFDFERQTSTNTYEWCKEGVRPEIVNLQNLSLQEAKPWLALFEQGKGVCIRDLKREEDPEGYVYQLLAPQDITSLVAVPLLREEKIVGLLGVDNPKAWPEDLSLMRTIAQFVSNDMEKRRILHELERTSNVDLLARVFNRNRYITDVEQLCRETTLPIGTIFLDLDNLKEINDTRGHDFGDALIQKAAAILYTVFPEEVYRIGGDEFIVLHKGATRDAFENRVQRLRARFEADGVSISMGYNWRLGGAELRAAILYADKRMYEEKAGKRARRGVLAGEPTE